jgi:diaminohydroxyphosphoribosylaminopyrimidine deaminase/5-amino-6-(5-phosphoribosylamino)uracil reductase
MIGIGTALVDDPRLTIRLPGLAARTPLRVVLDATARLKPNSNLLQTARDVPLVVVVGPEALAERKAALADAGARIKEVGGGSGGLDIHQVFRNLSEEGLTRILVEGGAQLASTLVAEDLLDEVILFRAPVVVGPDGVRALSGYALSAIERSPRFRQIAAAAIGEDQMRRYLRAA